MRKVFELPLGMLETMAFAGHKGEFLLYGQYRYGHTPRDVATATGKNHEELRLEIDRKLSVVRGEGGLVCED